MTDLVHQRSETMALAPLTVHLIPDRLRRDLAILLQSLSTTSCQDWGATGGVVSSPLCFAGQFPVVSRGLHVLSVKMLNAVDREVWQWNISKSPIGDSRLLVSR